MKQKCFLLIIGIYAIVVTSCMDWPRVKKVINNHYYYIREERGTAFTSTVYDYEFYAYRKWLWDTELGNIQLRSEDPADSVQISYDSLSGLNRIIMIRENTMIFDSLINFKQSFYIEIGLKY